MKYCVHCEMNLGNVDLIKKEGLILCPKCENEIVEIKSNKLTQLITDITNAFYNIKDVKVQSNAQELIKNAKLIEQGEKKLKKEYLKHLVSIREQQYELEVIQKIGEKLNYKLEG